MPDPSHVVIVERQFADHLTPWKQERAGVFVCLEHKCREIEKNGSAGIRAEPGAGDRFLSPGADHICVHAHNACILS